MTTFHLAIDRRDRRPLHRQIYEGLQQAILDGRLRPGQRLPSTRALSLELGVSRLPVLTAYDQLIHEGYLSGRVGSGTFVSSGLPADLPPSTFRDRGAERPGGPRQAPSEPTIPGARLDPFQIGIPALDRFPQSTWARLIARHARALTPVQMSYGDPAGQLALRVAVAAHLRAARAVRCEADDVIVVSGSQAALHLAGSVLLAPGGGVAIEDPGYFGAQRALRAAGARLVPIPVDDQGLSVAALDRCGKAVRAVYVTPSHQYPLGASMSAGRRLALLNWAARRGGWILEDDYDSEFRYVSQPLGSVHGMDTHGRVVYIGTFSKALFPAMRIGYLVVPPALRDRFVDARKAFDFFPPSLYQLALAEFLGEGHYGRHLRRMHAVYLERRQALLDGIARHCEDRLHVHNADGGLHMTVLLHEGLDDRIVAARMADRRLIAAPLSACFVGAPRRSGLLLGFGTCTPERLTEATRTLGEVLRETLRESSAGAARRRRGGGA
jgi:GntR family transcriptional regulator / MocR family aminotransferase